ncbi:hypothetical protein [Flavobacterium sp. XS2P14]|uniref:hypothetical protein n=1 Tax=Flavobacterium sp. XS2P14 TaxID=3401735 RepID=UPI003AAB3429
MANFKILFSDYFNVDKSVLDHYGTLNLCLSADLPLFLDPFLLFASEKKEYKLLHKNIVDHLISLKNIAVENRTTAIKNNLFKFPEIKQNWLGMSKYGNGGKGLGDKFAKNIVEAFNGFYNSFGNEEITEESHIEKLTILNSGVGKDFISDFTTNLIFDYLLNYTEEFALKHLQPNQIKEFNIRCVFDENLKVWLPKKFKLPFFYLEENGDFIILTPIDILTKDDSIINNNEFYSNFKSVANSIDNLSLRESINEYFRSQLPKKPKKDDVNYAIKKTSLHFPEIIDYYIKLKEENKESAANLSKEKIQEILDQLIDSLTPLSDCLLLHTDFYSIVPTNSYDESLKRVMFLKSVIEDNDGYRIFYNDGKAISKEDTIQRIFRLTWYATPFDVNAEVNNGRGPADYKVSFGGKDSTIVEFKLGKSSSLSRNLANQTDIYKKASKSANDIKVILCYTEGEIKSVERALTKLDLIDQENIVIIDASPKKSASTI